MAPHTRRDSRCEGTTTTATPAASGPVRLGCGTFCQSAGGFGGANPQGKRWVDVIKVVGGAVSLDADGYVPVTLTCLIPATCKGAIWLSTSFDPTPGPRATRCGRGAYRDGCSDLVVNANSTQTIGVPLTADALAYVRANCPVTVGVKVDTGPTAQCEDIPQLAPTCGQIIFESGADGKLQVSAA
jgi:hypothetical protein